MSRPIRFIVPELPHHTLQRGNNRQVIFHEAVDRFFFLKQLREYARECKVMVGAYCLMSNHYHLLLYPETQNGMIKLMKSLSQIYAQYFNRKYDRTGKIWENRYKLNIVEPEYDWVIARYIEKNPVRAGMVSKAEEYPYSSAAANLGANKNKILTKDIIKERRKEYIEFFHEAQTDEESYLAAIRSVVQQQKSFGSKGFIEKLKDKFNSNFEVRQRGRPVKEKK